jgi:hypothetical protein
VAETAERWCKSCENTLPLTAFNRYKDGYQWRCRECFKAYFRDRGQKHIKQVTASRDARRVRAHVRVLEHLSGHGCADCGEADPIVLEFDHIAEKTTAVSELVARATRLGVIDAEVAKCEIVCCNCHRRRTYQRRGVTRTRQSAERIKNWRVRRNLEWLYTYLGNAHCEDCGVSDALLLEFDHIALKRKNVMAMAWEGYGQDTIQIEMNKCEIRCANCHRRKTAAAGQHYRHRIANRPAQSETRVEGYSGDAPP